MNNISHNIESGQPQKKYSCNTKIDPSSILQRQDPDAPRGGGAGRREGAAALPCLYSNNSIENPARICEEDKAKHIESLCDLLTPYHKKQAATLKLNVERLIEKEAISPNHVGFLTLTFPDNVVDNKEAYERFRSLNSNFLSQYPEFGHWINTKEQQKRGAWHYHLVVCLKQDIRTGIDFEELKNRKYTSASPYLRKIWKDLREAMPKYGFGRSELQPIRSNAEAMARYIGKYISKHIGQRDETSKGVRLVSYSRGWPKNSIKFAWHTKNSAIWRQKVKFFAWMHGCQELYQLSEKLGSNWAYRYLQDIYDVFENIDLVVAGKDQDYESPVIKNIEKHKNAREKKMVKNLTLHSGKGTREREIENDRLQLQAALPFLIEHYVRKTKIQEVPF